MREASVLARIQAIPAHIRLPIILVSLVLPGYGWLTYTGLYRGLAELQLRQFGAYNPPMTGLLLYMLVTIPVAKGLDLLSQRYVVVNREAVAAAARRLDRFYAFNDRHGRLLHWLGGMLILTGFGIFTWISAMLMGPLTTLTLTELEAGTSPRSRYVEVEGIWDVSRMQVISDSRESTAYVPLVSSAGRPVALFVSMREDRLGEYPDESHPIKVTGTLSRVLPGLVRVEFERANGLVDPFWVLDEGETPENTAGLGIFCTVAGLIACGIVVLIYYIRDRQRSHR